MSDLVNFQQQSGLTSSEVIVSFPKKIDEAVMKAKTLISFKSVSHEKIVIK